MTMSLEKFLELKQKVEERRRESVRTLGALDQLMIELKEQFACNTLKEAKALRKKVRRDLVVMEQRFYELVDEFIKEHSDVIQ